MTSEPKQTGVYNNLYTIKKRLNHLHGSRGLSWRAIAALEPYKGISHATLAAIAKGREPKDPDVRAKLGLPTIVEVRLRRDERGRFASDR